MNDFSLLNASLAFLFGILSFLSPCVLPLLPGYLSFITGTEISAQAKPSRSRAVRNSTGFVFGFSILFVGMGAAASGMGRWLAQNQVFLQQAAGIIIIILGLHISELLPLKFLYRQARWQANGKLPGWLGACVLGISFAAGWTPCVGPVLASILILAGSTETLIQGAALLSFYSAGLAVPFILSAWGIGHIHGWLVKMNRILPYVNALSGGLLISMGILLLLGWWNKLAGYFYGF